MHLYQSSTSNIPWKWTDFPFPRLILGMMLTSSSLSMWLSNTATTAMMLPIANAILVSLFGDLASLKEKCKPPKDTDHDIMNGKLRLTCLTCCVRGTQPHAAHTHSVCCSNPCAGEPVICNPKFELCDIFPKRRPHSLGYSIFNDKLRLQRDGKRTHVLSHVCPAQTLSRTTPCLTFFQVHPVWSCIHCHQCPQKKRSCKWMGKTNLEMILY